MTNETTAQSIALEVLAERDRQDAKWGEQNHPDGTGPETESLLSIFLNTETSRAKFYGTVASKLAAAATSATDLAASRGLVTWTDILLEEVFEAFAESDPAKLRTELIQVAAVAQQWVQAIDRRAS